jgi:hypothetical protein
MNNRSQKENNSYALVSLVLAIVSLLVGYCNPGSGIPIAVAAVICGHIAISKIRYNPDRYKGMGYAIAGLVIGYLYFLVFILLMAFSFIAVFLFGVPEESTAVIFNNFLATDIT